MNSKIQNILKNSNLLLLIIIVLQLTLLIYLMYNKVGFFGDEIYTYTTSNSRLGIIFEGYGKSTYDCSYKWSDGQLFKDYITVNKDKRFDYKNVYNIQTLDTHPPFYFYLIHTICSMFPESFSKWYGLSLNIIVFVLTQILLFAVCKQISFNDKYALLTCFSYGFSTLALDCFVYIRMYALLTFFYLLLLYLYILCLKNQNNIYKFLGIVLTVFLGGLTQYHFYVFAFFLSATFVIIALINKKYKMVRLVSCSSILGFVLSILYYPYFFVHVINSPRGSEVFNLFDRVSPSISVFSNILQEFSGLKSNYCIYLSLFAVAMALIIFIYFVVNKYFKNINLPAILITSITTFIYISFIYITIDYKLMGFVMSGRYLFSICPFIFIIINAILFKLNKFYITIIFIILCGFSCFRYLDYYFPFTEEKFSEVLKFGKLIENNNAIIYCSRKELVQAISLYFVKCNKVFFNPFDDYNKLDLPDQLYPDSKPTYLFVFPPNKIKNLPFPKVIEGEFWENKFEVYDLNVKIN